MGWTPIIALMAMTAVATFVVYWGELSRAWLFATVILGGAIILLIFGSRAASGHRSLEH